MKVLYISYSCDPYNGSEDQIGFNIPLASFASGNTVTVITKKEHEENIRIFLSENPEIQINFIYIDIHKFFKTVFKGLLYSMRIILWQLKSEKIVRKLCIDDTYNVIHQVAPIEFRAIGNYGGFSKAKYILGPIGGGFKVPKELRSYTKKYCFLEVSRNILNAISFYLLKRSSKIKNCDYIFFTNEETKKAFDKHKIYINNSSWSYHCDIGVAPNKMVRRKNIIEGAIVFLVPGRLNYRKGHNLLFDSIPRDITSPEFVIRVVGTGPLEKKLRKRVKQDDFLNKHVHFVGRVSYTDMIKEYDAANVVILPSLSEATGTVLIESMSRSKPVITGDYFGSKFLVDKSCSWVYLGKTKQEAVYSLQNCIKEVLLNPDTINEKGLNAYERSKAYTWNEKIRVFNEIYTKCVEK